MNHETKQRNALNLWDWRQRRALWCFAQMPDLRGLSELASYADILTKLARINIEQQRAQLPRENTK